MNTRLRDGDFIALFERVLDPQSPAEEWYKQPMSPNELEDVEDV